MNRALIVSLVSALLCTAVAFAQPADPTDLADPIAAPAGVEARSEEDIARRSKVYATIGEATITVGEIEDAINAQSPFLRVRYREPAKMQELAENLIRFELLAAEAERRGYGEHAAVVRSVGQNAVQQLIRREFDQRITPDSIPEEDVRAYYAAHREEFARPEMVRASHILLGSEEEAQQVLTKVREADARTFRQLAREQSVDTETKLRGGDLRFFTREGRPPGSRDAAVDATIVEAAFAIAEVGQVGAAPVQVGEHWSVIKLTGRRPAEERAFEESARGIRLRLW
ncbi:MAG: peptidyl-prolyl cis-trans isomerase, partial [Myxococcales bacterium]|nr:peptidyl-prolyl cis-trans isomerase [Myxococcales bacterium]